MRFIYNQEESCKSKIAYETYEEADEVRGKQASKSGKPLKIYKCERCGLYHLTSKKWE
jgi:hypothetical protein